MVDLKLLKTITSKEVALRYLGLPEKENNKRLWYKSPFRNEKTASFCVSEKGFHDFGDSWHGDSIEFVKRFFNLSFNDAVKVLSSDFGLNIVNEYETTEILKFKKMQRESLLKKSRTITEWFNKTYNKLCDYYWEWQKIVNVLSGRIDLETYKIALDKTLILEYLIETFIDYSKDKEVLYNERRQIECCLI